MELRGKVIESPTQHTCGSTMLCLLTLLPHHTRHTLSESLEPATAQARDTGTVIESKANAANNTRHVRDKDVGAAPTVATCPATSCSAIVHGRASPLDSIKRSALSAFTCRAISSSLASAESMSRSSIHSIGDIRLEPPMACGKGHSRGYA